MTPVIVQSPGLLPPSARRPLRGGVGAGELLRRELRDLGLARARDVEVQDALAAGATSDVGTGASKSPPKYAHNALKTPEMKSPQRPFMI